MHITTSEYQIANTASAKDDRMKEGVKENLFKIAYRRRKSQQMHLKARKRPK